MFGDSIVVVPWDFSKQAKYALELALEKARAENIRVVCVLERPEPYTIQWGEEREARALEKCEDQFWDSVELIKDSGIHFTAEFGSAAGGIVDYAKSQDAGFILMSTHGRTGINRLMMGSVAQRVMQTAGCPVLLLPNRWCEGHHDEMEGTKPETEGVS